VLAPFVGPRRQYREQNEECRLTCAAASKRSRVDRGRRSPQLVEYRNCGFASSRINPADTNGSLTLFAVCFATVLRPNAVSVGHSSLVRLTRVKPHCQDQRPNIRSNKDLREKFVRRARPSAVARRLHICIRVDINRRKVGFCSACQAGSFLWRPSIRPLLSQSSAPICRWVQVQSTPRKSLGRQPMCTATEYSTGNNQP
jgi:hypothetical protein